MLTVLDRKTSGKNQIVSEIIVITPDMAKQWLEHNKKNRKVTGSTVAKYARDIKEGRWQITGDAIRFDTNKNLIDGQHRLLACVKADMPFSTAVTYGLPPEAQDVMDMGKMRSAGDVLSLHGLHNTNALTTAIRTLMAERDGIGKPNASTYSTAAILECLEKHPLISRHVPPPGQLPRGIPVAQVGYVRYVASEFMGHAQRATAMFEVLKTGVPDYTGDPIHAFRERIIRNGDNSAVAIKRESKWWTLKHAFNLFVKGDGVTNLRFARENCTLIGLNLKKL